MSLSLYDSMMLGIVVFCVIHGAIKGMAWQLAPIASLVLGYLFGMPLSTATAQWFGPPPLNSVFSLITMYMLVSLGVYLIARSLRDTIEKTKLVEFDRHLGALLGGVKGVLFTTVLTVGLVCISPSMAGMIVHSESRTIAENIIGYVGPLLPTDVHKVIDPYLKPIEALPDDPLPIVKEERGRNPFDVAEKDRDTVAPRTRRHNPIYEDDTSAQDEPEPRSTRRRPSDDVEEEPAPRRRRASTDTEESDDSFGGDPNQ